MKLDTNTTCFFPECNSHGAVQHGTFRPSRKPSDCRCTHFATDMQAVLKPPSCIRTSMPKHPSVHDKAAQHLCAASPVALTNHQQRPAKRPPCNCRPTNSAHTKQRTAVLATNAARAALRRPLPAHLRQSIARRPRGVDRLLDSRQPSKYEPSATGRGGELKKGTRRYESTAAVIAAGFQSTALHRPADRGTNHPSAARERAHRLLVYL